MALLRCLILCPSVCPSVCPSEGNYLLGSGPTRIGIKKMRPPPTFFPSTHGCAAAGVVLLLLLPETMWCLRLLLLVVLLPWSSSVKRERTPAGTPLITEWFGEVSSAPADAVSSATPTSPLPPCRLIDETDELPATETPATPIQDVTRDKFRRRLHLSEGQLHGRRVALRFCSTSKKTAG